MKSPSRDGKMLETRATLMVSLPAQFIVDLLRVVPRWAAALGTSFDDLIFFALMSGLRETSAALHRAPARMKREERTRRNASAAGARRGRNAARRKRPR